MTYQSQSTTTPVVLIGLDRFIRRCFYELIHVNERADKYPYKGHLWSYTGNNSQNMPEILGKKKFDRIDGVLDLSRAWSDMVYR